MIHDDGIIHTKGHVYAHSIRIFNLTVVYGAHVFGNARRYDPSAARLRTHNRPQLDT